MRRFRTLPLACSLLNRPRSTWKASWSSTSARSQGSTTCLEIIVGRQPVSSLFSDLKSVFCFYFRCTTPDGSTLDTEKDSLTSSLEVVYLRGLRSFKVCHIQQFLSFFMHDPLSLFNHRRESQKSRRRRIPARAVLPARLASDFTKRWVEK